MKQNLSLFLSASALVLFASSCDRNPEPPVSEVSETVYRVTGVVRKVIDDGAMAVIDHEEIPGYMAAMSMPFYPKDPALFLVLKPGQRIEFDYYVDGTRSWVENIKVIADTPTKEG